MNKEQIEKHIDDQALWARTYAEDAIRVQSHDAFLIGNTVITIPLKEIDLGGEG